MVKAKALNNVTVLDLTHVLAGPLAVTILADFGANVIQIEPLDGDYGRHLFSSLPVERQRLVEWITRRNRRGMTLNLADKKGKEIFIELAKKADVIVQDYSPGSMERIGLDYDTLKEVNPGIIYCEMTGFGRTGPYKDELAYDPIIQAASGLMSLTGFPNNPPVRAGIEIAAGTGATYAAIGILLALHYKDTTGKGQMIDCAMFDAVCQYTMIELIVGGGVTGGERIGNQNPLALTDIYQTKDGEDIVLWIQSDAQWESFLVLAGKNELIDEKWSVRKRLEHKNEIDPWIRGWVKSRTIEEVKSELTEAKIAHHRITSLMELKTDPQVLVRELLIEVIDPVVGKLDGVRGPIPKLSETPGSIGAANKIPKLGQHTEEILSELLGYSKEKISTLRQEGVI